MRVYLSGEGATAPPEIVLGDRCFLMLSAAFVIANHRRNDFGREIFPDQRFAKILNSRTKEIWRSVKHYTGLYRVSNKGRVESLTRKVNGPHGLRTIKGRILIPQLGSAGYYHYGMCKSGKTKCLKRCRLVAQAFIPNPNNKKYVNHRDGDKLNDAVYNLEWATKSEDSQHAHDLGLHIPLVGSDAPSAKLTEYDIPIIRRRCEAGELLKDIADDYGVHYVTIIHIRDRKIWRHVT